mgnify:FL=1
MGNVDYDTINHMHIKFTADCINITSFRQVYETTQQNFPHGTSTCNAEHVNNRKGTDMKLRAKY